MHTISQLNKEWKNPGKKYRSIPFWAWNTAINAEDTRFQIQQMQEQGMGGFFIHSREGLETPYLSEEWMAQVDCAVKKAEEKQLEVWIYDEDKWPSGSAGGMVSAKNPASFTAKGLTFALERTTLQQSSEERLVGIYPYDEQHNIVLRMEISNTSEWYNHQAPSDNLNAEAVRQFILQTHERYKLKFSKKFGKVIKGFFTDEPNCFDFFASFTNGRPWLPWTEKMLPFFIQKRGYDPTPLLPGLFLDWENAEKIRHDYWRTITELFSQTYMKQIYDWCEQNHLMSTGHILYENDLGYQVRVCGAAMPQYRYLHCPGIDLLGNQTKEYLTLKQCTSVANQYGREMTVTEAYGCTGWDFTFEGQKHLMDFQAVCGITRRCQHLALYSLTGCRKRDYPPVFHYQTTWWEENHYLEEYCGRLSAALRTGTVVRDILVIHPMSSIWMACKSTPDEDLTQIEMNMGWTQEQFTSLNKKGEEYNRLAAMLLSLHYDFDFGDEIILAEEGSVQDDKIRVKCASYSTVIVPRVTTLFESTLMLLTEFSRQGGTVIWVGELPERIEGEKRTEITQYFQTMKTFNKFFTMEGYEELPARLNAIDCDKSHISIKNEYGLEEVKVLSMLRKTEDGYILFIVNQDRKSNCSVKIELPFLGAITGADLLTGKKRLIAAKLQEHTMSFCIKLPASGSQLFFIETMKQPNALHRLEFPYEHPHSADKVFAVLGPVSVCQTDRYNILPLDTCIYTLDNERSKYELPVWQAQKSIRETLEMPQVYYNGAPQRYTWLSDKQDYPPAYFTMTFSFTIRELPQQPIFAVVEKPDKINITCNGKPCIPEHQYFLDRDMKLFRIPNLSIGDHSIKLSGIYTKDMELEDIYLAGDFAVNHKREIIRKEEILHFGDWCFQGYPFYPGNMDYEFLIDGYNGTHRLLLKPGEFCGTLLKIWVNSHEAGILLHNSEVLDISEYIKEDRNKIVIRVVGSPRNMFGPFHQGYTGCSRISWEDFRTEGSFYTKDYVLKPYGLMGQIVICEE